MLTLDPVLDLTKADSLKRQLLEGDGVLDAAAVQRITTPCLALLVAAVAGGARFVAASDALKDAARTLGLTDALGLADV